MKHWENYVDKIKALKLDEQKTKTYSDKFNKINQGNIKKQQKTVDWLLEQTKKMIDEFKKQKLSLKTKQTTETPSVSTSQKTIKSICFYFLYIKSIVIKYHNAFWT
ncbi:hypothetical protein NWQ33_00075 [Mycoplasmopsis cynos]|nr:hypothetical protein [Mycoplasmopsis cynos]